MIETPKIAPLICANVGLLAKPRFTATHAGEPFAYVGVGTIACHVPAPPAAAWLNHSRPLPPASVQSLMVTEPNELSEAVWTSKYAPDAAKVGEATGSDPNCDTVKAPAPTALTVVPSLVATVLAVGLFDTPECALVAPDGAEGV